MDGQYGNVSFICTHTDELEATETLRDHADVAQQEPGRWEKMTELSEAIADLEKQRYDKVQQEEDLKLELEEAKQRLQDAKKKLRETSEEKGRGTDVDAEQFAELKSAADQAKKSQSMVQDQLDCTLSLKTSDESKCRRLQSRLKGICAAVRNDYSKSCLQEDFRSGLKAMFRKNDDDDGDEIDDDDECYHDDDRDDGEDIHGDDGDVVDDDDDDDDDDDENDDDENDDDYEDNENETDNEGGQRKDVDGSESEENYAGDAAADNADKDGNSDGGSDSNGDGDEAGDQTTDLPDDFNMEVFCISSNDYLKLTGIKPDSDGPPNTFKNLRETQIPILRSFVHDLTFRVWWVYHQPS
jgi:hypothetical protein